MNMSILMSDMATYILTTELRLPRRPLNQPSNRMNLKRQEIGKKIFRLHVLFVLILSLFFSLAAGPSEAVQKKFVIGGFVGPHQTLEQYLLYKQAGFNTVLDYPWEDDKYQKTLELAGQVGGLDVLFSIDQMFLLYKPEPFVPYMRIDKFIKEVRNNPSVLGYALFDEPKEKEVPLLVAAGKYIQSLDPERLTWISFFLHNEKLARNVLDKFVPTVISAPEYPYRSKDNHFEELYLILERYRTIALQYKVPLWLYVQSASWPWPQYRGEDRRAPTNEEIRMQVYSNLAYGAKGLWYFTYVTTRHTNMFTSVILDKDDKIKPGYFGIKAINAEVQALAPLLMKLSSVDVMHVKPDIKGVKPFSPNNVLAKIAGENLLIGFFKDSTGADYFMLVNKLTKSANRNIQLAFRTNVKNLSQIDKKSGKNISYKLSKGSSIVNLEAGDGLLFKVH